VSFPIKNGDFPLKMTIYSEANTLDVFFFRPKQVKQGGFSTIVGVGDETGDSFHRFCTHLLFATKHFLLAPKQSWMADDEI
jgi:hypothetical protein